MIGVFLLLIVAVMVVRSHWLVDLIAGAAILAMPIATVTGEWGMLAVSIALLLACVGRIYVEARL